MATEFELSVRGTRKVLANSAAVSEKQAVKPSTVATARVDDKYAVEFRTGKGGECRGSVMEFDIAPNAVNKPGEWAEPTRCLVDAGAEIGPSYLLSQIGDRPSFVFAASDRGKGEMIATQTKGCGVDSTSVLASGG